VSLGDFWTAALIAFLSSTISSFLVLVAARAGTDRPWLSGRSRCDGCDRPLGVMALLPVLGWMIERGRCSACGARIAILYPALELAAALGGVSAWWRFSGTDLAFALLLLWMLLLISAFDLISGAIPRALSIAAGAIGLLRVPLLGADPIDAVAGLGIAALLFQAIRIAYRRIRRREGMGLGDVILAGAGGAWIGMAAIGEMVLVASASALAWLWLTGRGGNALRRIPFAPFLALGIWICYLQAI
jgi:leader peptidase (prepilin peptidase)/N-methyltransferase